MGYTHVKGHYSHRHGKRIYIRPHTRRTVGSRARGRSGKRFKKLAGHVTKEYEKKGYSKKRAEYIGKATAGKVFWRKYGKKKGKAILRRER